MLNILIKGRSNPSNLNKLLSSIRMQDYTDVNIYLAVDDELYYKCALLNGVKNVILIPTDYSIKSNTLKYSEAYNMYYNALLCVIDDGYVMFLDETDYFTEETSLSSIMNNVQKDRLNVFRIHDYIKSIPFTTFGEKIMINDIYDKCVIAHIDYAKKVNFMPSYLNNGQYAVDLNKILPEVNWISDFIYELPHNWMLKGEISS